MYATSGRAQLAYESTDPAPDVGGGAEVLLVHASVNDRPNVIADVLAGEEVGTIFLPKTGKLESRKRWIAFFQRPAGTLVVDNGARRALCDGGKSLLAATDATV